MNIPVVHRFYPCCVTHCADSEDFCWNYFNNAYFIQGGKVPEGFQDNPCSSSVNCTVEILEYPDGTCSAGWFPGEFREEKA